VRRVALCPIADLREGEGRGFRFGAGAEQVAVLAIRWRGEFRAYINACPHVGTPLDGLPDRFFDRERRLLLCGTHGARFRPEDGVCVAGPCVGKGLRPLALTAADGMIAVTLP
jgi:naringenin degradation protein FdeD